MSQQPKQLTENSFFLCWQCCKTFCKLFALYFFINYAIRFDDFKQHNFINFYGEPFIAAAPLLSNNENAKMSLEMHGPHKNNNFVQKTHSFFTTSSK